MIRPGQVEKETDPIAGQYVLENQSAYSIYELSSRCQIGGGLYFYMLWHQRYVEGM